MLIQQHTNNSAEQPLTAPYSIGQAAAHANLSTKQLRDYEKKGLIAPMIDAQNGYRYYTAQHLAQLQFIAHARGVGFTLAQIGQLLASRHNPTRKSADIKALALKHINELDDKILALSAMRAQLADWASDCKGDSAPDCAILAHLEKGKWIAHKSFAHGSLTAPKTAAAIFLKIDILYYLHK